jgi:hypothetical protein
MSDSNVLVERTRSRQIATSNQRRERIKVDADERHARPEGTKRGQEKPAASGTWVHDTSGSSGLFAPTHHSVDDMLGRVRNAAELAGGE